MEIGEKIKKLRVEKKMSQKELADILGVKQPTVAYFEGRGNVITIEQCIKIATALDVSIKSLLFDDIDYTDVSNNKELENLLIEKNNEVAVLDTKLRELAIKNKFFEQDLRYERLKNEMLEKDLTSHRDFLKKECYAYLDQYKEFLLEGSNLYYYTARLQPIIKEVIKEIDEGKKKQFKKQYNEMLEDLEKYKKEHVNKFGNIWYNKNEEDYDKFDWIAKYEYYVECFSIYSNSNLTKRQRQEIDKIMDDPENNEDVIYDFVLYNYNSSERVFCEKYLRSLWCVEHKLVEDEYLIRIYKTCSKIVKSKKFKSAHNII